MEKKWSQSSANFYLFIFFAVGKRKSACFLPQWRVGSSSNDVKINKRNGEMLCDGKGSVIWRDAFSLCGLCQGDSGMWGVDILHIPQPFPLSRLTYCLSGAWRQRTARRKGVSPEEFYQIVEGKLDNSRKGAVLSLKPCCARHQWEDSQVIWHICVYPGMEVGTSGRLPLPLINV